MPSNIEERVVQMRFDNAQFEKGAAQSLRTLDKLEGVLDQLGTGGGLEKIGSALDSLERRFSNFGVAGAAAISHITTQVVDLAERLLTAIPRQIISGGTTRATNIEQARFQLEGLSIAWDDVSSAMDYAVADTAYGLDEAAKAAAQFAASGVSYQAAADGLSDMHKALRAISGVAGMTNSSYDEIAHIFTGIAGTGKVMTQDLRMLEGRGLNVAAKLAEVLRDGPDNIQYTEEQIREMVSKGEIDFLTFAKAMDAAFGDHAKKANETFTGSLANMKAALSRIGADFVMPIHKGAVDIFNAFRNTFNRVRKITQPFAEGKFTEWVGKISSAIAKWAESIDFSWLEGLVYMLNNADFSWIENAINKLTKFNETLHGLFHTGTALTELTENGARTIIVNNDQTIKRLQNLRNIFKGLKVIGRTFLAILSTIGKQFGKLGGGALNLADGLLDILGSFGEWLDQSDLAVKAAEKLEKIFTQLERVVKPVARAVKAGIDLLAMAFKALFDRLKGQTGPFGSVFGTIFEWVVRAAEKLAEWLELVRDTVRENGSFVGALDAIGGKFQSVHDFISRVTTAVGNFLSRLFKLKEGETVWDRLAAGFQAAGQKISEIFGVVRTTLAETFGGGLGTSVVKVAGAILGVFLGYRKLEKIKWASGRFSRTFTVFKEGLAGLWKQVGTLANLPDKISTVLSRTSGALRAFTDNQNAEAILKIGAAVLVLSLGLAILAAINVDRLAPALGAVAAILTMLVAAFAAINFIMRPSVLFREAKAWSTIFKGIGNAVSKYIQARTIQEIAKAMMFLGIAVLALSAAVWVLSKIEPERLWESVGAVIAIFAAVGVALIAISKLAKPTAMFFFGAAMIGVAAGLLVLVAALGLLSLIPADRLKIAGIALAAGLGAMTLALLALGTIAKPGKMLAAGIAMVFLAGALVILAAAFGIMALIPADRLKTAGIALGAGLAAMAVALALLSLFNPLSMIAAGAAMVLVSGSLLILAAAMAVMALIPTDKLLPVGLAFLAMVAIMVVAIAILGAIGPIAIAGAAALLLVALAFLAIGTAFAIGAVGMIALAAALNMMDGLDLAAIGKGLKQLGKGMFWLGVGGALAGLGVEAFAAMIPLATALEMMRGLDLVTIGKGLGKVGVAMIALGLGGIFLGLGSLGLTAGVGALLTLTVALPKMAEGLNAMSNVAWGTLGKAFALLAGGAVVLFLSNLATLGGIADPTDVLINLGNTLPVFATGLHTLDDVPWESIGKGIVIFVEAAVGALAANIATLGGLADPSGVLANFGKTLPILASGLHSLDDITWETIGIGFGALATAISGLIGTNIATFGGIFDPTGPLANFSSMLPGLAEGIKAFNDISGSTVGTALGSLATGIAALIGANLATAGGIFDGTGPLKNLADMLPTVAIGIDAFSGISGSTVGTALGSLATGIVALIGSNLATAGGIFDSTGSLKNLADMLPTLATGIGAFSGITGLTVGIAFKSLGAGIAALLGSNIATAGGIFDGTGPLKNLADIMPTLATGIGVFKEISGETVGTAFEALATGIAALIGSNIATFGGIFEATGPLKNLGDMMPTLATGFEAFKEIDGSTVGTAFAALAGGITAIIGTNIATAGGIFEPNTGALAGLGLALPTLATGLHSLDDITWDTIATAFGVLATGIGGLVVLNFANLFGEGGSNQLASFGEALTPLSAGLKEMETVTWGSIGRAFTTLATGIGPLLLANFGNAEKFLAVGQGFEAIATAINQFPENAGQRMKDFVKAIKDDQGDVSGAVGELLVLITTTIDLHKPNVEASMTGLVTAMTTTFTNYKGNWGILGLNVSVGIANGITRGTVFVSNAMGALVRAGISAFTSGFLIRSPSHLMENLSEYIPMGAGRGIQNGSHYITDGMIVAFSPALAYLDAILNSDYDFQPTIRPVVDMTDAVSGANSIRDMLASVNPQSVWGGVSGVNAINVDGAAIDYRVQNDGIVNEIRSLSDRMDALGDAISNMQIILDTGVLVGETSAAMDDQLGVRAMRKRRGI